MPLPEEYLASFRNDIVSHERRIAELRKAIRLAEEEVALHEVILSLAHNDRLISAVGDLYDESNLTSKFRSDPLLYCQEENIPLPEGVTLSSVDTEGPSPRLTALVRRGSFDMEIVWERDAGFFVRPALPPSRAPL
jgi:hypothetical protein